MKRTSLSSWCHTRKMKSANYNYTDEAGHHQKWKRARRRHQITPLSTNCPSMQTREPPTVAGSIMEATAGEARGWREGHMHRAQFQPLCSKGTLWGWWVTWAWDRTPARGRLLGRLWAIVSLKVQWHQLLSASERPGKAGLGQMLLRCKCAFPEREREA